MDRDDLSRIVKAFRSFCKKGCVLAVDCTGFSNFLRLAHFFKRCKQFGINDEPRTFSKASFVVDAESLLIVSARTSSDRRADIRFMPEHISDLKGMDPSHIVADKGYDCEGLHKKIRRDLWCVSVIPCRESRGNRGFSTHGVIRNQMKMQLVEGSELRRIYNRRPMVETVNYMVKTHTGSHALSRLDSTKQTQILCKALAHDCKLVVERGYLQVDG